MTATVTSLFNRTRGEGRRARTHDELIADVTAGAQRLSISTRSWATLQPADAAIDEALRTAEGLRLALIEMRNQTPRPAA